MIDLKVADYCQNCQHFEAQTDEISSLVSCHFIITCANMEKCRAILKYIEENKEKM
jgi:hypothetical protein